MKNVAVISISVLSLILFSCKNKNAEEKISKGSVVDSTPKIQTKAKPAALTPTCFMEDLLSIKSESELKSKFGADHISIDTIWGEQGAYVLGSFIDANTKNEVQIMWKDFPKCTSVSEVIIQAYSSPLKEEAFANEWKSKKGVGMGMTTSELEKINGRTFVIGGFDEAVYGDIDNWKGGKIIQGRPIEIHISAAGKMNKLSQKEMDEVFDNYNIPSDNKVIQKIQPRVVKITVFK